MPQIETRTIVVTPEQATRWLERNTHNRPKKPPAIERYARDMADGRWQLSHQGIAFAPDGTLLDGQNRLHAVIKANVAVPMQVTFGLDLTAQAVVDDHARRSVGDVLSLARDERGLGQRQVAIGLRIHQGLGAHVRGLTRLEQIAVITRHLDAIEWTLGAIRHHGTRGLTQASVLAVIARAWYTRDRQRLLAFADALLSGETAKADRDQAVIALRNWLLQGGGGYGGDAIRDVYAKSERALVAFFDEERLTRLYAVSDEQFPVPGDADWPLDASARRPPATRFEGTVNRLREWHADA